MDRFYKESTLEARSASEYDHEFYQWLDVNTFIDSCVLILEPAMERNFKRWPILGVQLWIEPNNISNRTTYQSEVDYLKEKMA